LTEAEIQRAVFAEIAARGMPGVECWAVPNNREARRTVGFRAGVADVNAVHRGRFYAVELKKDGGRASQEQLEFVAAINTAGGYACVAEGLPEAICILESWGLLRKAA
jgi:hypothetical protein